MKPYDWSIVEPEPLPDVPRFRRLTLLLLGLLGVAVLVLWVMGR